MSRITKGVNDLKTKCLNSGEWGQRLINEWVGEDEEGNTVKIDEVPRASHKKVKWKCNQGHEWAATIHNRICRKSGCPYCSQERQSEIQAQAKLKVGMNDLETWCKNNGSFGRQLMNQWVGEDEEGNKISMNEVAKASNKKVKWKCSQGHEWVATIGSRTRGRGCPHCSNRGTSYPEQYLYHALKQIYPNTENRSRVLKSPEHPQGIEFDIGIPEIPLCIEYSPTTWHRGKEEYDGYKKHICEINNVRLIQIIDDRYDELEYKLEDDYICLKVKCSVQTEIMQMILEHILKTLNHSINEIDLDKVEKDTRRALENKGVQQGVNDLETWCRNNGEFGQQLINEWVGEDENNNKISINSVSYGGHRTVKWKCNKGHEWTETIHDRTSHKTGCPYCHSEQKSLDTWCNNHGEIGQQLINEWVGLDENNNPISMDEVTKATARKVKWRCNKGHEWTASIHNRTSHKTGCPYCSEKHKKHKVSPQNSLATWCQNHGEYGQQLINEWAGYDEQGNKVSMDEVSYCDLRKVKWKDNSYASIFSKTKGI